MFAGHLYIFGEISKSFLIGLSFCWIVRVLCVFWTLSDILFVNIFSHFVYFYFFHNVLWCTEDFNFMKSNFFFSFVACSFTILSKNSLSNPRSQGCTLRFSMSFIVSLLKCLWSILRLFLLFVALFYEPRVQLHSFTCGYPDVAAPFAKGTVLSYWINSAP